MSATNHTQHYNLPQFLGTDKPAWLVDFNGSMSTIDTSLYAVQTDLDTAESDIDELETDMAEAQSDIVALETAVPSKAPISHASSDTTYGVGTSSAYGHVKLEDDQTQTTAGQAALDAHQGKLLKDAIQEIKDYFTISETGDITITAPSGASMYSQSLKYALNEDSSLGKIYGSFIFDATSTTEKEFTTDLTVANPSGEAYTIVQAGIVYGKSGSFPSSGAPINGVTIKIAANGAVSIACTPYSTASHMWVKLYPCLYFFQDFGDTPEQE